MCKRKAARKETESFLNRVYNGSISLMVSGFMERQKLTEEEIEKLRQILKKAEEGQND